MNENIEINFGSKIQQLIIPFGLPNMNDIIALSKVKIGRGTLYDKKKKQITEKIIKLIINQKLLPMESIKITFHWQEKNRRRDPDNFSAGKKFILDGLVKAGIIENDGWKNIKGFSDQWVTGNPGCICILEEV